MKLSTSRRLTLDSNTKYLINDCSCYLERTYSSHLDEEIESGKSSGVTKTPTFFINGDRYDGSWDLDSLLGALDEASVFGWKEDASPV